MSTDQAVALIGAIASLVGALAWPAIGVFLLIRFHEPISDLITGLQQVSLRAGPLELSGTRAEVAASVTSAEIARNPDGLTPGDARALAANVSGLVTADTVRQMRRRQVLWVDDRPENNRFEAAAFRALGLSITTARTTEEALRLLSLERYDLVISDMGRPEGATAGYELLESIRERDPDTPFVIYAGSDSDTHRKEAERRGAQGSTNRPEELVRLVIQLTRERP